MTTLFALFGEIRLVHAIAAIARIGAAQTGIVALAILLLALRLLAITPTICMSVGRYASLGLELRLGAQRRFFAILATEASTILSAHFPS